MSQRMSHQPRDFVLDEVDSFACLSWSADSACVFKPELGLRMICDWDEMREGGPSRKVTRNATLINDLEGYEAEVGVYRSECSLINGKVVIFGPNGCKGCGIGIMSALDRQVDSEMMIHDARRLIVSAILQKKNELY